MEPPERALLPSLQELALLQPKQAAAAASCVASLPATAAAQGQQQQQQQDARVAADADPRGLQVGCTALACTGVCALCINL